MNVMVLPVAYFIIHQQFSPAKLQRYAFAPAEAEPYSYYNIIPIRGSRMKRF